MKTCMTIVLSVSLVLCMIVPALAQENSIEQSARFMETLVSQIKTLLAADNVLGTPIEYEGMKIIPIVSYGFGFGGGSGMGRQAEEQGGGAGGGGGGGVMPVSFLVITKDGKISVLEAKKGVLGELVKGITPVIIEAIKSGQQKSPQEPPAEEAAKEPAPK